MQDYYSFKSLYPSINMGKYHKRVLKVIECEPTVIQTRQGPRLVDHVIPSTPSISSAHSSPSKSVHYLQPLFMPMISLTYLGPHTLQNVHRHPRGYDYIADMTGNNSEHNLVTEQLVMTIFEDQTIIIV